jgi:hypothetical protein
MSQITLNKNQNGKLKEDNKMSRNDYTKYARENRVETPVSVEESVVETVEPEVVEEIQVTVPEVVEMVEPEIVETSCKMGRVIGCMKLNVRRAPKPRAEVICEINCDTEVEVNEDESTIDFYKICTASGIEGYCVKTYIGMNPDK